MPAQDSFFLQEIQFCNKKMICESIEWTAGFFLRISSDVMKQKRKKEIKKNLWERCLFKDILLIYSTKITMEKIQITFSVNTFYTWAINVDIFLIQFYKRK